MEKPDTVFCSLWIFSITQLHFTYYESPSLGLCSPLCKITTEWGINNLKSRFIFSFVEEESGDDTTEEEGVLLKCWYVRTYVHCEGDLHWMHITGKHIWHESCPSSVVVMASKDSTLQIFTSSPAGPKWNRKKRRKCLDRDSNWVPCAHHADVPTTTPGNPVTFRTILSVLYYSIKMQLWNGSKIALMLKFNYCSTTVI